ncbi:RNA methyltransferase [Ruegeria sp. HKCCD6109]|uniref:RNA methyltransferase n=1 Tax=Ruegeria sp. HKCCD6109 TaxID=2683017 RepID=UPI001491A230|nr:RNA methyltransferase [Ruegeria sp. HKCCD6109]NOD65776.1 TrmH family RNA methyltransferase [Ruegeria sp. HKCCD6109]
MSRGFSCISLFNPKTPENVGGVLRASYAYGVSQVNIAGRRTCWNWMGKAINHATNTPRAHRHTPVFRVSDPLEYLPFDCPVVAVDLIDGAKPLPAFQHPEKAVYVFGPEDGTLGKSVTERAQHVVYVPTRTCMNLAATVNVVLYDRLCKRGKDAPAFASESATDFYKRGAA